MYEFAVVALLGLAILKVVDLLAELVPGISRVRTLATFTLAVATVAVLDYSLFSGFGIDVREDWMGTVGTGLIVGSLASAWQAVFGYLGAQRSVSETRNSERPRIAA